MWITLYFKYVKLREAFLVTCFCLFCSGENIFAQEVKISFDLKNVSIEDVFNEVRKNSDFKILFMNSEIDINRKVSIQIKEGSINEVLNILFINTDVVYEVVGRQIVLKIRSEEEFDAIKNKQQDNRISIEGKVLDIEGLPISNVSVIVKNTDTGVSTDFDGHFSVLANIKDKIEFSFLGMKKLEITIVNPVGIVVVLEEDVHAMDEVVVTALGMERSKRSLAYSITKLEGNEFTEARETNIANSLAGKVAGVNVSNTVTGPAGTARVIIRGNTSLTGNNQPLYVVDGIPIDNTNQGSAGMWGGADGGDGIGNLNPDDIETMSILKGNTSAALYGSRASNGVIIITTKKGKLNEGLKVELNSNFTYDYAINLLDPQTTYGHGINGQKPTTQEIAWAAGEYSWGEKLDGSNVLQFDGVERPYSYSGNNFNKFYNTGKTFTNTLSFYGGSNNLGFRFSASHLENESIMPNSGMKRQNLSINMHGKGLDDKLSFNASTQYIIQDVKNHPALADSPNNSNYTVWQLPVSINIRNLIGDPNKFGANKSDGLELMPSSSIWFQNPYWAAYQQSRGYSKDRVLGSFSLDYKINDWISLNGKIGIDQWDRLYKEVNPTGTGHSPNGSITESQRKHKETNFDFMIRVHNVFNNGFGINALVGANKMRIKNNSTIASANNFALPFFYSISNGLTNSGFSDEYKLGTHSVYGQIELSYNSWIYLTGSGRNDWFSTLNGKRIFYPSIGISTVLSEIFDLPKPIDDVGFRVSWAQVGGATDPYALNQSYELGNAHLGVAQGGISGKVVANALLTPLTVNEFEIGANAKFFKNRLALDFVYYNRKTKNDILEAPISETSGFDFSRVNVGEVTNKGIEFLMSATPIKNKNFLWNISFNMSYNKSEVVSLLNPHIDNEALVVDRSRSLIAWVQQIEGLPYGQVSGFKYLRDSSGEIAINNNGYPIQDTALGVVPFGTGVHPFVAGVQNRFEFKNWSLDFLVDFKYGAVIHSGTNTQLYRRGVHKETLNGRENGLGVIPASQLSSYYDFVQNKITEEFIYDADFIKFRELVLSYQIPQKHLKDIFLDQASISIVGRNLFIIQSSTDNIDPESTYNAGNAQGLEYLSLPQTRSFGLNINLKF